MPKKKSDVAEEPLKKRSSNSKRVAEEQLDDFNPTKPDWEYVVSTGSTLLDLAISGKRLPFGGVPSGILMEASGSSGSGKSLLLTELAARVQKKGGDALFADPEDRLDKEYASMTGMDVKQQGRYERPDTVTELFDIYNKWEVDPSKMNIFCGDSLAALSTEMEMSGEDKMGMRRAKEFSEALRKSCRTFKQKNVLMVCSNQIRDGGPNGTKTIPGGNAVPFYSSVRLKLEPAYPVGKIKKEKTINGVKHSKVIGVITTVTVIKNSLDDPFRKIPLYIVFGYGIDDIRANLMWYKETTGSKKIWVPDGKEVSSIDKAIEYVEEADLAKKLRASVRDLWREIENEFKQNRKPKEF